MKEGFLNFVAARELLLGLKSYYEPLYYHSIAVAGFSLFIGRRIGLKERQMELLACGGALHDLGKAAVDMAILKKPGSLSDGEWVEVKKHPQYGAVILLKRAPELKEIEPMIKYHHEWWNGKGYLGLKGSDIPLEARIIALADALDAMAAPRPYRKAMAFAAITAEVAGGRGTQFDPAVVDVLAGKGLQFQGRTAEELLITADKEEMASLTYLRRCFADLPELRCLDKGFFQVLRTQRSNLANL